MKRISGLVFASVALVLAFGFASSAMAIPPNRPGPNDNQSICHQTQHHQNNEGDANDNQKGVIINVDPSSIATNPHIKHGDKCVAPLNPDQRAVDACTAAGIITEAACTGNVCDIQTGPFPPAPGGEACCAQFTQQQCIDAQSQACLASCF